MSSPILISSPAAAPAAAPLGTVCPDLFDVPAKDRPRLANLPTDQQRRVKALQRAFETIFHAKNKEKAFAAAAASFHGQRGFSEDRLRARYFEYIRSHGDWTLLVNAARCPAFARNRQKPVGLPAEFIEFWKRLGLQNKRKYRPAWKKLNRLWREGAHIDGYGTWKDWFKSEFPDRKLPAVCPDLLPSGWSYEHLMRHNPPKSQEVAARVGQAAAREFLPQVLGTREGMRFLQQVTFDDVKTDFRVIDPDSGQVCDLWLLVAHDKATDVRLGYGMRPAVARDDGTQTHLKLRDMKQLAGFILHRWGIAPYAMEWKVERGTATFSEASALAINQLTQGRLTVHYSSMIGGTAPSGYKEKAIGNSRGKGAHEAGNNLLHNECGDLPGQTGRNYSVRPTELAAREQETRDLIKICGALSPHLRDQVEYPVLTLRQAKAALDDVFDRINRRIVHECEGFEEIIEWMSIESSQSIPSMQWMPIITMPNPQPAGSRTRVRRESPYERMFRLAKPYEAQWQKMDSSELVHFYEDSHRVVPINEKGEIVFKQDGRSYTFIPPSEQSEISNLKSPIVPGAKFLAYHHPHNLDFIHLAQLPPHGGYVGTWAQKGRVPHNDREALAAAMEYTAHARKACFTELNQRHIGEVQAADARRAHNDAIFAQAGLVPVAPNSQLSTPHSQLPTSPVGSALIAPPKPAQRPNKPKPTISPPSPMPPSPATSPTISEAMSIQSIKSMQSIKSTNPQLP